MTNSDRAHLARELHDGIAQDLVGVGYSLDLLLADPESPVATRLQLRTLRFTITDLIDKVRREIYYLREVSNLTLAQKIEKTAQEHCAEHQLQLAINETVVVSDLELEYEIGRIAEEVLRNVALHAKAKKLSVSLSTTDDAIELRISDDGIGGAVATEGHFGLQSIYDRTSAINGEITIQSDFNGTNVLLRVPTSRIKNE